MDTDERTRPDLEALLEQDGWVEVEIDEIPAGAATAALMLAAPAPSFVHLVGSVLVVVALFTVLLLTPAIVNVILRELGWRRVERRVRRSR